MQNPSQSVVPSRSYQIWNKGGHSTRLCPDMGSFAYVGNSLEDSMSNLSMYDAVVVDDKWCLDSDASYIFYDAHPYVRTYDFKYYKKWRNS